MIEFGLLFAGFLIGGVIWYHIGYRTGWESGREHELDKAAQRHVRMSRFSDMQHKKG